MGPLFYKNVPIHESHLVGVRGNVIFCYHCGSISGHHVRDLRRICPRAQGGALIGPARTPQKAAQLSRILRGDKPYPGFTWPMEEHLTAEFVERVDFDQSPST